MEAHHVQNLIGRDNEAAILVRALRDPGAFWHTLVGPPGVGKSALARVVAAEVDPDHLLVDLTPEATADPVGLLDGALAAPESGRWILLDGIDHLPAQTVADAVTRVRDLAGPRVLATTRTLTGHSAEYRHFLGPLAVVGEASPTGGLALGPAQRLFGVHARRFLGDES